MDGAKALCLPTKLGQKLSVKPSRGSDLIWISQDTKGENWFEAHISLYDFSAVKTTDPEIAKYVGKLLKNSVRLNSEFLDKWNGFKVITELQFPLEWGLGSSSSLTYALASWADVNPFFLHFKMSDGSGYDIACAGAEGPLHYTLKGDELAYAEIEYSPSFKDKLYFVYLEKKEDSNAAVRSYLKDGQNRKQTVEQITDITNAIIDCKSLDKFDELISQHEDIISAAIGKPKVKDELFSDYWGGLKSLGAWGGDFVLASSTKSSGDTRDYFRSKGFETVIPYEDLIL